jgi:hypothetical protein
VERLPHLRREVEVRLEAERARHVVQERAFDRHDVDDVHADETRVQPAGEPERVLERTHRVLGSVESDEDVADHLSGL